MLEAQSVLEVALVGWLEEQTDLELVGLLAGLLVVLLVVLSVVLLLNQ